MESVGKYSQRTILECYDSRGLWIAGNCLFNFVRYGPLNLKKKVFRTLNKASNCLNAQVHNQQVSEIRSRQEDVEHLVFQQALVKNNFR